MMKNTLLRKKAFMNGKWVNSAKSFAVVNPATGGKLADVVDCGEKQVLDAITAAENAFPEWSAKTAKERAQILMRWHALILDHVDDLAALMTAEQGKPLAEAVGEIKYGASFVEWFAEEGKRAYGDVLPTTIPGARMLAMKQPVGVCAAITPWNFPSAMITRKVAPALAAGCSVVIKPAAETPLSALALAALAEEAGMPPGVLNIIPTSDAQAAGEILCADRRVRKLSFTGSTRVGKILMRQCADTVKKLSLELGGNAPFIVFEDADIDAAVAGAMASKFRNAGQTCVCANRIYVQGGVYDEFVEKFTAQAAALTVGDGAAPGVEIGPLISEAAIQKVQGLLADAVKSGAQVRTGGNIHPLGGLFFEPTVLTDVDSSMRLSCEEIFGPVAPLYRFSSEDEVIALANDTAYGLASYFYARDMGRVWRVAEALESGVIAVNSGIFSTEVAPFGGFKESGIGREGSRYGLDDYLEIKYVLMGGLHFSDP